jgi:hypothetical protein
MINAKVRVAPPIFLTALCVFLLGPERREEIFLLVGVQLNPRTVSGFSIIGMVFGLLMTLKALAERRFASESQTKYLR